MSTDLEQKALDLRKRVISVSKMSGAGHIASSLSSIDILNALYNGGILRIDCKQPEWRERDRFILSKGHATLALYNVLVDAGFVSQKDVDRYCQKGSIFGGHTTSSVPGVECNTGSLGHGLSFAIGSALCARLEKADYLTIALSGDGECQEGSMWEAAMFITHYNLINLVWIIDKNNIQLCGRINAVMNLDPLDEKLKAFGFDVKVIDGHNYDELMSTIKIDRNNLPAKPIAIIANTIKGKGVPLMEDVPEWHGRKPNADDYAIIYEQLRMPKDAGK
ncbi:MAG: transketolase [Spirochaetaceae bacterium]|nr:transketolase [Spirochaetaceae bacterium]